MYVWALISAFSTACGEDNQAIELHVLHSFASSAGTALGTYHRVLPHSNRLRGSFDFSNVPPSLFLNYFDILLGK